MVQMSQDPRQSAMPVRRGQPPYLTANPVPHQQKTWYFLLEVFNFGKTVFFPVLFLEEWISVVVFFFLLSSYKKMTLFKVPKMYLLEEFRKTHKFKKEVGELDSKNTRNQESFSCLISMNCQYLQGSTMAMNVLQMLLFYLVSVSLFHPTQSLESWKRKHGQPQLNGETHPCLRATGGFFK